jgi:translation initiation factor 3 subunit I
MLQGHERSITQIKYNREGDLLFSCSKDNRPNVWFSVNGERLGTYNGHQGAVWCLDVDWTTTKFMSGGGDMTCRLWSVETGQNIATIDSESSVRTCNFSFSGNQAAYSTDKAMNKDCDLFIVDTRTMDNGIGNSAPIMKIPMRHSKITSMLWFLDDTIITGHENGLIASYDLKVSE